MQKTHSSGDSRKNPFKCKSQVTPSTKWSFDGGTVTPPLDHGTVTCGSRSHDLAQKEAALHPLSQPGVMSDFVTVQLDIHHHRASGTGC